MFKRKKKEKKKTEMELNKWYPWQYNLQSWTIKIHPKLCARIEDKWMGLGTNGKATGQ